MKNKVTYVDEGKRWKLVDGKLPLYHGYIGIGVLALTDGMYWCPETGEALAAMIDTARGEFQLYGTGLYFLKPFTRLTRGSARMLAAVIAAAGHTVAVEEQPDGDTGLLVTDAHGMQRRLSAALLAANVGRYACSVHSMVQCLMEQVRG